MTAPRPGDAFHLDLDGTVIAGRYIEADPPHRLVIGWDRQGTDTATPTPTFIEITLTPTGDGTNVKVQLSGLSAEVTCWHGSHGSAIDGRTLALWSVKARRRPVRLALSA